MRERTPPANIEQYRRRKRRAGNIRWLLVALLLIACAAAGYAFSMSPFFGVEQVIISGNEQVGAERLTALSGIIMGQNIFSVDTLQVERRILIEPFVEGAQVERYLPRTVKIAVTERRTAAVLATGQSFVQIDNTGLVLRRMRELDNLNLPILSGITSFPPGVMPGSRLEGDDINVALAVLNSLPEQAFPTVKEIDVTDDQKIRLYTEGGIEVRVGDISDIAKKYYLAESIIYNAQLDGTASQIGYIDISSTEKPAIFPNRL